MNNRKIKKKKNKVEIGVKRTLKRSVSRKKQPYFFHTTQTQNGESFFFGKNLGSKKIYYTVTNLKTPPLINLKNELSAIVSNLSTLYKVQDIVNNQIPLHSDDNLHKKMKESYSTFLNTLVPYLDILKQILVTNQMLNKTIIPLEFKPISFRNKGISEYSDGTRIYEINKKQALKQLNKVTHNDSTLRYSLLDMLGRETSSPKSSEKEGPKGGDLVVVYLTKTGTYVVGTYSPGKFNRGKSINHFTLKDPLYIKENNKRDKIIEWLGEELNANGVLSTHNKSIHLSNLAKLKEEISLDNLVSLKSDDYLQKGDYIIVTYEPDNIVQFLSASTQKAIDAVDLIRKLYDITFLKTNKIAKVKSVQKPPLTSEEQQVKKARQKAEYRAMHPSKYLK